jgi:hypothetical protein
MVAPNPDTRSDGPTHIGRKIKQIIDLTLEEGLSWQTAADRVGMRRSSVYKAWIKPHVRAYRLEKRRELIESLSTAVPKRLSELMHGENEAASVRACLAMEDLRHQAMAEPHTRRIQTGGIVIMISGNTQRPLPIAQPPLLELAPVPEREDD